MARTILMLSYLLLALIALPVSLPAQAQVEEDLLRLEQEIERLTEERNRLARENARHAASLDRHARELSKTNEQKAVVEQRVASVRSALSDLSREALEQSALATAAREQLVEEQLRRQSAQMHAQEQSYRLYLTIAAAVLLAVIAAALYLRFRAKTRSAAKLAAANKEIETARKESDDLLANILPLGIARELKATGKAKARQFPSASVLFCDFVNFTSIAEQLGAEALVQELDRCFRAFDEIVDAHPGVEKIKTIGDAYMAASGLEAAPGRPIAIIEVALAMQRFLEQEKALRVADGLPFFRGRIGLHTGPVVAGVVGQRKFAYDIWGDTVNIASRLESESEPGRVNVSSATQELVSQDFKFECRGKVEAKNKGAVTMYFVEDDANVSARASAENGSQPHRPRDDNRDR